MRNVIILFALSLGACGTFNGLEPMCQNADEEELAQTYASYGTNVRNFDVFANQCAKYGYRVPSKEKFLAAYNERQDYACSSAKAYFQSTYKIYATGGSTKHECSEAANEKFNLKVAKEDAFEAYLLKKSIGGIDDKIDNADRNYGKKKYHSGIILDSLLRAAYEDNPISLRDDRQEKIEKLKVLVKKYGLYISDLDRPML